MSKRKFGNILLDLEILIDEAIDDHDVQCGDILSLVFSHIKIHRPDCIEVYEDDNQSPVYYYGPKENIK